MIRFIRTLCLLVLVMGSSNTFAQFSDSPIRIFGYFQNSFQYWPKSEASTTHPQYVNQIEQSARNSFNMQQLNLFISKDLDQNWRAFINFEMLNTFSSQRQWGAFNLEEAWIRYKPSDEFNLKLGLLIPVFNNLNEIKNRTPLLPYIIRPLTYETSFSEFFSGVEEGAPARAFVQASGILAAGKAKFDYALYLGNSPNINDDRNQGQTGIDTTNTLLLGGRIGVRLRDFKFGFSATYENINQHDVTVGVARYDFIYNKVPRIRLGSDLSFHIDRLSFEGEFAAANYDPLSEIRIDGEIRNDTVGEVKYDGRFYYGTLGYQTASQVFIYASYWHITHDYPSIASQTPRLVITDGLTIISGPTVGISYKLNDRITLKGQYAAVRIKDEIPFAFSNQPG